jgi:phosphoglucomutase
LGVALRNDDGEFEALSGNDVGILLLDYILLRSKEEGKNLSNGFIVKSFVTTSMAQIIAKEYGVEAMETPVGFKFIGEKIKLWDDTGKKEFIFGFEESCGYLRGTHARDKDAVVASLLFAEMVCYYNMNKISVFGRLNAIFKRYGYFLSKSVAINFSGLSAMNDMNAIVDKMKEKAVCSIGGVKVEAIRDYSCAKKTITDTKEVISLDTPKSNCVYYELAGGGFVCLRPSGTEPKLKVYYTIKGENKENAEEMFEKVKADFEKILG